VADEMAGSPFRPGYNRRPPVLAGRDEVLAAADEAVAMAVGEALTPPALLLVGQRGVGKTVLLGEIADRAAKAYGWPRLRAPTPPSFRATTTSPGRYPCVVAIAASGYTADDLDLARLEFGVVHIEIDPWGNLIVTPASDPHERAVAVLHAQLLRQIDLPDGCVLSAALPWRVPDGSRYTNVPDLMVIDPRTDRVEEWHLAPAPLLVVEVASPSTRAIDRSRKLADYRLGGAGTYLLIDLPGLTPVARPTADLHNFASPSKSGTGLVGLVNVAVGVQNLTLDLDALISG
jgi:Putative restriction endonuclease